MGKQFEYPIFIFYWHSTIVCTLYTLHYILSVTLGPTGTRNLPGCPTSLRRGHPDARWTPALTGSRRCLSSAPGGSHFHRQLSCTLWNVGWEARSAQNPEKVGLKKQKHVCESWANQCDPGSDEYWWVARTQTCKQCLMRSQLFIL